ncbi:MAG: hypothetical protein ACM33T_01465 [Solirubrobacterales bacterium]
MQSRPAHEINAGSFVYFEVAGRRTLCLKVEREGKDHTNHFLVPLDPLDDRRTLALHYIDPEVDLVPVDGVTLDVAEGAAKVAPEVGDMFLNHVGAMLKVLDGYQSQRLYSYVDVTRGTVKPRMEHHIQHLLHWAVTRI